MHLGQIAPAWTRALRWACYHLSRNTGSSSCSLPGSMAQARSKSSKPEVSMRDYVAGDRAHLARCLDTMHDHMVAIDPWHRLTRTRDHSRLFIPILLKRVREQAGFILVAEVAGEPVGVSVAWERKMAPPERTTELPTRMGYLSDLAVLPGWRGRGIGTELLRETERRFKVAGCDVMTLAVFPPNKGASKLYGRHGFTPRGTILGKRLGPPLRRWPSAARTSRKRARARRPA